MARQIDFANANVKKAIEKGVEEALVGLGMIGVTQARTMCPVDTGKLRASITWKTKKNEGSKGRATEPVRDDEIVETPDKDGVLIIGTNVEYAPYVEYGSEKRNILPQPYMLPARQKVIKTIESGYVANKISKHLGEL